MANDSFEKFKKALRSLENSTSSKSLLAGAFTLQKFSMENAPVKTGFLRNSHGSREVGDGAEMYVAANYGFFVEFGTSKWAGKPFVRPALDEHQSEIVKAISDQMEKELEGKL